MRAVERGLGMDDARLVRQVFAGEREAYGELIDRWAGRVMALCHARVGGVAEEPAREALLRATEELASLPDPQRFDTWLAGIVVSTCRDWVKRRPERPTGESNLLLAEIATLPDDYRTVLLLHLYQSGSYADLGKLLHLSAESINKRLSIARCLLTHVGSLDDPESECESARALLSARFDNEIAGGEGEFLDAHLKGCHPCRTLAEEWPVKARELHATFGPLRESAARLAGQIKGAVVARAPRKHSILVVDDEPYILPTIRALLATEFEVVTAASADEAKKVLDRRKVEVILSDQRMPGQSGVELLEWVRQNQPETVRLLMTGYSELDDAVDAINRGHVYYYLLKPWRTEDLLQIVRNAADKFDLERKRERYLEEMRQLNQDLERRVAERTRELQEANHLLQQRTRELERLALTDPLTGLFNRRAIEELLRFELKRHARYPNALSVGFVDVDFFKRINTDYLLTGGDEVLRALSRMLQGSVREVDSVGRVGGEEFLVVARETGLEGAMTLAERIRQAVEETPIEYNGKRISITVSVGFAVAEPGVPAEQPTIVEVAAAALAQAKASGRNRCEVRTLPGVGSK